RNLELAELADEALGLRLLDAERFDHLKAALADQLRKDRSERAAIHLLVDLLREAARTRRERAAAADEDRSTIVAVTRAAALLLLKLLGRAGQVRTRLLRFRAGAARVAVRDHDLMHEAFGKFAAEHRVGDRQRLLRADYLEFHRCSPQPFAAGLMTTSPPGAPGTEPRTAIRWRSASIFTTSRFIIDWRAAPMWP